MQLSHLERIYRADNKRISRFHTANGFLIVSFDVVYSFISTMRRILFKQYSTIPWIPYKATRRIAGLLRGKRLLELGSGTSTAWYAQLCENIISFENNQEWFNLVKANLIGKNITYIFAARDEEMASISTEIICEIDVFVIDCQPREGSSFDGSDSFRRECLVNIAKSARRDAIYIIDNTDSMDSLSAEISKIFEGRKIEKIRGWVPGIMHPNETTIVI